jgi:hypothetical protein
MQVAKMLGYSNEINPFGDASLLKPFVWGKKGEHDKEKQKKEKKSKKDKKRKRSSDDSSSSSSDEDDHKNPANEEDKRLKLLEEIEKVRKRRENREKELVEMERLRDEEQRLRELSSYNNWKEKEEEFHLEQIKERTKLRLLEDRVFLIDRLITNVILFEASQKILTIFRNNFKREIEELMNTNNQDFVNNPNQQLLLLLQEPAELLSAAEIFQEENAFLTVKDYQLLKEDILQLKELDERRQETKYTGFWNSLVKIIDCFVNKLKRMEQSQQSQQQQDSSYSYNDADSSTNNKKSSSYESIQKDIEELLKQKSFSELKEMEKEIQENLKNSRKLNNTHHHSGNNNNNSSRAMDVDYWEHMLEEIELMKNKILLQEFHQSLFQEFRANIQELQEKHHVLQTRRDDSTHAKRRKAIFESAYQPQFGQQSSSSTSSSQRGGAQQNKKPKKVLDATNLSSLQDSAIEEYLKEMEKEVDLDDTEEMKMLASDEVFLPVVQQQQQQFGPQDKYRPRKPRYFNRVKTGWDRNKYNLTHYDPDNPPPKMIQGYKFTIFYPDLIDKTKPPKYYLQACPDEDHEFVMIRFHAGPPYEDIAFKIINKQWDTHRRAGFICSFDRGILQLHFNFKKAFYRR